MKLLLDTHILVWAASYPEKLSVRALELIQDSDNELIFSVVSIWEMAIKYPLGKLDPLLEPKLLRAGLLFNGYSELPITADHALGVAKLPTLHKDPFDRILIAQANCEAATLVTSDMKVSQYPGSIVLV